jgi:probable O-glycosylation ligase (exosortase A-associated)
MKQMIFMALTTFFGMAGSFVISPVWGIAVYYGYAVLRPQFIWEWVQALGVTLSEVSWSYYVAVATLLSTALWRLGLLFPLAALKRPWYGNPGYTRTHYLFLAFVFWISLTYYTAISQERAWPWFLEYTKIFVMFICATLVLRTIHDLWIIYYVVLGAAFYAAYEINFFYLADGVMLLHSRGYGGLDNNGAALIVAMAVPLAYFAWEATRHRIRWLFLLMIPVLVHALMLSFSRGGMLSLCVGAVMIWLRARHKGFLSCVYVVLGLLVIALAGKELQDRFFSISQHDMDESANSRKTTWKIAIQMANERPLFGLGIRNSNLFTHTYGADMEGRSIHSQYLQLAADSGWVALGLYLAVLLSLFLGLWEVRQYLRRYHDPESLAVRSMASALECALVLFCFGAIFLSLEHFEMPYILMLLAIQLHAITRRVKAYNDRVNALAASAVSCPARLLSSSVSVTR